MARLHNPNTPENRTRALEFAARLRRGTLVLATAATVGLAALAAHTIPGNANRPVIAEQPAPSPEGSSAPNAAVDPQAGGDPTYPTSAPDVAPTPDPGILPPITQPQGGGGGFAGSPVGSGGS